MITTTCNIQHIILEKVLRIMVITANNEIDKKLILLVYFTIRLFL